MVLTNSLSFYITFLCFQLYLSICSQVLATTASTNITTDQSALLALKASVTFDPHGILANNWSIRTNVCHWAGVTCGKRHHRVTALNLSNMGLEGTIPPNLGNLSFLISLNVFNNSFHGHLPHELGHLRRLQELNLKCNNFGEGLPSWLGVLPRIRIINLENNSFTGTIPSSICNMSNLQMLSLQFNSLEGSIPRSMYQCPRLNVLILGYNKLSGELSKEIANLTTLEELWLTNNQFTGIIPPEIGKLQNLRVITMEQNQLTGPLPAPVFNISTLNLVAFSKNNLVGNLPTEICDQSRDLEGLYMAINNFSGPIPSGLYKCSKLQILSLSRNDFVGPIAREIGNLTRLTLLSIGQNNFAGTLPSTLFNNSALRIFAVTWNLLSGTLPMDLFSKLSQLEGLYLSVNEFSGVLLESLTNASNLINLDLSYNKFTGAIPKSLGSLRNLEQIRLGYNNLSASPDQELSLLDSLTLCRRLWDIGLQGILMNGLPESIGNFSNTLEYLHLEGCGIKGKIPVGIGNLSNLILLGLGENSLAGFIPSSVKGLQKVQSLDLDGNLIQGPIPEGLCLLQKNLGYLQLSHNQLTGRLPDCFENLTSVRTLYVHSNRLTGTIPIGLWNLSDLLYLDISSNLLLGQLPPEIGKLKVVVVLNISHNQFFGNIPTIMGELQNLKNLSLAHNRLTGSIPDTFQNMLGLGFLDLSYNNMSGTIPKSFEKLKDLYYFNVSFNHFMGEIPGGGPFANFTSDSFISNGKLCGGPRFHVPPCETGSKHRLKAHVLVIALSIGFPMLLTTIFIIVFIRWRKGKKISTPASLEPIPKYEQISNQHLLEATEGFSDSNLLGEGSFASVYKGILSDGMTVAIKVFKMPIEMAAKSFDTECKIIREVRHRNLTPIITSCSNLDFRALIMKYMLNGSLEKWLYSHNHFLNILQRLDIMIDVACAFDYLHHGSEVPVVHCDLKPSNILLDADMVGHVSDFGIAKLLDEKNQERHTKTLGTIGYVAPEYGSRGSISTSCDVYSFGIMLMETFTRKRPTDEMFAGDQSLRSWVYNSIPNGVAQVVDGNLLQDEEQDISKVMECVTSIMELAIHCSVESPNLRMNMSNVLLALKKIRIQFSSIGRR